MTGPQNPVGALHGSRKRLTPIVTYTWLWPGCTRAWLGEWPGLGQAAAFALFVDAMLLVTVVWDEVLGSTAAWCGWSLAAVWWSVGALGGRRRLKELAESNGEAANPSAVSEDLFPEALNEYLQGNWLVAEEKCRELVRRRRDDVESRLLLSTILRHTLRWEEARRALDDLEKFDGADRWTMEIECERRLLAEAEEDANEDTAEELERDGPEPDELQTDELDSETAAHTETTDGSMTEEPMGKVLPTRRAA